MDRPFTLPVLAALVAVAGVARADGPGGRVLPEVSLPTVAGGSAPLADGRPGVTALIFFRAENERSAETLRMLARCRPRLAREQVRLVGVTPAESADAARGLVEAAGLDLPVLLDAGEEVAAAAGLRAQPAIAVVDGARRVVALEPFHPVDYCDVVVARVQRALGVIGDAELERVLAPPPSQLPGDAPGAVAHRHLTLARKLLSKGSFGPAHESARKALALAPSADAWRVEGEIFAAEGRCPDAAHAFDAALGLDSTDAAAAAGKRACVR